MVRLQPLVYIPKKNILDSKKSFEKNEFSIDECCENGKRKRKITKKYLYQNALM